MASDVAVVHVNEVRIALSYTAIVCAYNSSGSANNGSKMTIVYCGFTLPLFALKTPMQCKTTIYGWCLTGLCLYMFDQKLKSVSLNFVIFYNKYSTVVLQCRRFTQHYHIKHK